MHWVEWGTDIILWLQQLGGWLAGPMEGISFLGTEYAYLFMLPALFWCIDTGLGMRVGVSVMTAVSLNGVLKLIFQTPRPFWINPDIYPHALETSFGLPSGHSMNAVGLWGRLAAAVNAKWLRMVFIVLIGLIAASRLYLGVHYPVDVITGLLAGSLLVWLLVRFEEPVLKWFQQRSLAHQVILLLVSTLLLIGFGWGVRQLQKDNPFPEAWLERTTALDPENDGHPLDLDGLVTSAGTLFGVMLGGVLLARWGKFTRSASWRQALLRYIAGILILIGIYFGLRLLHMEDPMLAGIYRYVRYTAAGLWVSYGAPRLFDRLGLVQPLQPGG
jgi:membrane-associated phospholipid phosphatase